MALISGAAETSLGGECKRSSLELPVFYTGEDDSLDHHPLKTCIYINACPHKNCIHVHSFKTSLLAAP